MYNFVLEANIFHIKHLFYFILLNKISIYINSLGIINYLKFSNEVNIK